MKATRGSANASAGKRTGRSVSRQELCSVPNNFFLRMLESAYPISQGHHLDAFAFAVARKRKSTLTADLALESVPTLHLKGRNNSLGDFAKSKPFFCITIGNSQGKGSAR